MSNRKSSSWFYPNSTGDPGRDRNAQTLQLSCWLLAVAVGAVLASAYGKQFAATSLQADVEGFIRKPYSIRDLLRLVRRTVS
jgi:hypothetical protein